MNAESLVRGLEIRNILSELYKQREKWQKSISFHLNTEGILLTSEEGGPIRVKSPVFIDFNVVKTLVLISLKEQIESLEKEFESL